MYKRVLISSLLFSLPAFADIFADLKPGEWYEVPASKLESVAPNPLPDGSVDAVMAAWSGGAFDSKRDNLIVWGGGHGDYAGNEVYIFNVNTLKWSRAIDPSANTGGDEHTGVYPDGNPRSRHTYNYIQYVPAIDRFCTLGGAGLYPSGQIGTEKTFCLDFDKKKWEQKADALAANIGAISGYDDATGKVWLQGAADQPDFTEWEPVTNKWAKHVTLDGGWMDYNYTAAVGEGMFLAVGGGQVLAWDLKNPDAQPKTISTSGASGIVGHNNPGLVYDYVSKKFVAWSGGTAVYTLDLGKKTWSQVTIASTNKVTPTSADQRGTYGRWQYIPSKNAFIGVNRTSENVYIFKMNSAAPQIGVRPTGYFSLPFRSLLSRGDGWKLSLGQNDPLRGLLASPARLGYRVYSPSSRVVAGDEAARVAWQDDGLQISARPGAHLPGGAYVLEIRGNGKPLFRQGFETLP